MCWNKSATIYKKKSNTVYIASWNSDKTYVDLKYMYVYMRRKETLPSTPHMLYLQWHYIF